MPKRGRDDHKIPLCLGREVDSEHLEFPKSVSSKNSCFSKNGKLHVIPGPRAPEQRFFTGLLLEASLKGGGKRCIPESIDA